MEKSQKTFTDMLFSSLNLLRKKLDDGEIDIEEYDKLSRELTSMLSEQWDWDKSELRS